MRFMPRLSSGILGKADSPELWEEITSHISDEVLLKKGVKILCVACGHGTEADVLVKRMKSLGISAEEIKESIYLIDKYQEFTNYVIQKGYTNVIRADFMEWETDMKFDVVIGNPPYQSNNGSGSISGSGPGALWSKFSDKAISLVVSGGYVAFVTPDNIFRSTNFELFKGSKIKYDIQVIKDSTEYFNVGQDTVFWVLRNQSYSGKTIVDSKENIDLKNFDVLPKNNFSLYQKMSSHKSEYGTLDFSTKNQLAPKTKSDTKTNKTPYAVNANGKIVFTDTKSGIYDLPKVMLPQLSKWAPMYSDEMSNSPSTMRMLVKNKTEGKNLINLLNTKIYRFMIDDVLKVSGRLTWAINSLPLLDLTKTWTDEELYSHFGLTQEEIDYVESHFVKSK